MNINIEGPLLGTSKLCEPIYNSLPDWFGIEEANAHYLEATESLPTFLASRNGSTIGFLSVKQHSQYAAEIYVMGIHPDYHRQGIGRLLVDAAESNLRDQAIEYLQVKTLSPSRENEPNARTRKFYFALGFRPMEEFSELWGPENPCLMYVKKL